MKNFNHTKDVNPRFLHRELKKIPEIKSHLKNINVKGDQVVIILEDDFDDNDASLISGVITDHDKGYYNSHIEVEKIIESAIKLGERLLVDFANENVRLGITQLGLTNHVRKALFEVVNALATSALYDAIYEISQITNASLDENVLTADRLLAFRNEIEEYLGVTASVAYDDPV